MRVNTERTAAGRAVTACATGLDEDRANTSEETCWSFNKQDKPDPLENRRYQKTAELGEETAPFSAVFIE